MGMGESRGTVVLGGEGEVRLGVEGRGGERLEFW